MRKHAQSQGHPDGERQSQIHMWAVDKPPTAVINSCSVLRTSNLISETKPGKRRTLQAGRSGDYHSAKLYHTGGWSGWYPST